MSVSSNSQIDSNPKELHHYNDTHHGLDSASIIVDYLGSSLGIKPASVIDVGCGLAQWLKVFEDACHSEVLGIDGFHVSLENSYISESNRLRVDLCDFIRTPVLRSYDLVLCLEVAEHLDLHFADVLVDKLASLGNMILFSAAIPGQTGENHVNEQPHSFWLDKFEERGFLILDPFRKFFWNDSRINWWYSQNLFLVCKPSCCSEHVQSYTYDRNMYVHPRLLDLYRTSLNGIVSQKDVSLFSRVNSFIKRMLR
jgi:hypothetical protein